MKILTPNGFSLIEVLVSVFVLTIGVIGAAGMQLTALRTTQQSALQTTALHLAAEMADKMRTNTGSMQSTDNNPYLQVDYQSTAAASAGSGINCYGAKTVCDAQQLAQFDIAEWLKRFDAVLPGGRVRICRDAQPWNTAEQNYSWHCSTSANASIVIKIGWRDKNQEGKSEHSDRSFAPSIALAVAPYTR